MCIEEKFKCHGGQACTKGLMKIANTTESMELILVTGGIPTGGATSNQTFISSPV